MIIVIVECCIWIIKFGYWRVWLFVGFMVMNIVVEIFEFYNYFFVFNLVKVKFVLEEKSLMVRMVNLFWNYNWELIYLGKL